MIQENAEAGQKANTALQRWKKFINQVLLLPILNTINSECTLVNLLMLYNLQILWDRMIQ